MAFSEVPLIEAALMAIDDINIAGGVMKHRIEYVLEDGASDPTIFAEKAEKLITQDKVVAIFGGWNSHVRKSVKPVVEKHNILFWYPLPYEGMEESPNIFYTGSTLNQQIIPAMDWCWAKGWRRYYLLGSDYIYPITVNKLVNAIVTKRKASVVGEKYVPLTQIAFSDVIGDIQYKRPDVIINTLNGESNRHFFEQFHQAGFNAESLPIISTAIAEGESQTIGETTKGHYSCWTYFQSVENPENDIFISKYKERYGEDRVVSAPIAMAYSQIYMWKDIVEKVKSFDTDDVRKAAIGEKFQTPSGEIEIKPNHHVTKKAYIGKVSEVGKLDVVWETKDYLTPLPWKGVEEMDLASSYLLKEILSRFPDTLNFNSELERKISERTAELQEKNMEYEALNEELLQTNEELTQINDELAFTNQALEKHKDDLQERIRERDNLKNALSESALVSITNLEGKILFINKAFVDVTGYKIHELLGRDHCVFSSGFHDKIFWFDMWNTIEAGYTWRGEVKNKAKDGSFFWVDTTVTPIKNSEGKIYQYISVRKVITEKKRLQENQEMLLRDLADYAFLTSHKLRGPLARMLGLIYLVEKESDMSKASEIIYKLKGTSKELDEVIKEMNNTLNQTSYDVIESKKQNEYNVIKIEEGVQKK